MKNLEDNHGIKVADRVVRSMMANRGSSGYSNIIEVIEKLLNIEDNTL